MMRHEVWLTAVLLALGGCDVPASDSGYGYAQPGYPPGQYDPSGYPAPGYPGYGGYDGAPTIIQNGSPVPLVMFGGEWGYYDSGRHWHRAPPGFEHQQHERRDFDRDRMSHGQPPPPSPGFQPRMDGRPARPGEQPGGPAAFRPNTPPPMAAPAPRPAPAAVPAPAPAQPPQRSEVHRACPPGQRC